jgi:hypothetical protein
MTHFNCYELYITIPRDIVCVCVCVCVLFPTLLQLLHVRLPHVICPILSSLTYAATCRLRHASNEATALADHQLLVELIMAYPEHTALYTGVPYVWLCYRLRSTDDLSPSHLQELLCSQAVYYLSKSFVHPL